MKQFMKDITTGIDGESYDVVRVAMVMIVALLPFELLWGMTLCTWAFFTGKPFDLNNVFTAVLAFNTGAGVFLAGGSVGIFFKKTTEPDGTVRETEDIQARQDAPK